MSAQPFGPAWQNPQSMPPPRLGAPDDRGAGNASDTVLDAMLEAAFSGTRSAPGPHGTDGSVTARPPRGPGAASRTPRGNAQSASPRPQRWRPVDAVRLAKHEIAQNDGQAATLPTKGRLGTVEVPNLHDGFYDFAAAVVKPQPSARNYALQLREQLDEKLASVRHSNLKEHSPQRAAGDGTKDKGVPAAQNRAIMLAGERSCREVEICMETVENYIKDTSIDSKERNALLDRFRTVSTGAVKHLLTLLKTCAKDIENAEKNKIDLESSLAALEEDNAGLRHVVQQMLATEGDLQTNSQNLQKEVEGLRKSLVESGQRIDELTNQLKSTKSELDLLRDEQARGRPTCDRAVSPMMGFSTFVMSTDQVPAPVATDMLTNDANTWVRQEGLNSLSGFKQEGTLKGEEKSRRKTFSSQQSNPNMGANMFRQSVRLSTAFMEEQSITLRDMHNPATTRRHGSSRHGSRSAMCSPMPQATPGMHPSRTTSPQGHNDELPMTMGRQGSIGNAPRGESIVTSLPNAPHSAFASPSPVPFEPPDVLTSRRSTVSSALHAVVADSPQSEIAPSVLATSFSALLPFVDFATLDPGLERSQSEAMAQSQEHLEKHMVMLQDDYQSEVLQNEVLQHSVDTALERILVWVQAVHDSLQDLASNAVQQDVSALTTLRNAVQWLAKKPCKEWTGKPRNLEEVLDTYEVELRAHLEADRPNDSEVEELRKSIVQQRQRVQELSDQLLEARSSVGMGARSGRRVGGQSGGPSRRVSSLAGPGGDASPVQHIAVQCDLGAPAGGAKTTRAGGLQHGDTQQDNKSAAREATGAPHVMRATSTSSRETPHSPDEDAISGMNGSSVISGEGTSILAEGAISHAPLDSDEGSESGDAELTKKAQSSIQLTEHEAKKMRLFRSPFVEGIDFLLVPTAAGRVMLADQGGAPTADDESKLLGLKQLHAVIADLYTTKGADDLRRDKVQEQRRPLYVVLQEVMRRNHGVKKVVHQRSWLLIESMAHHSSTDKMVSLCSDFLDGTRDIDELSFYMYCMKVLTTAIADDSKAFPAARLPNGFVSYSRAQALAELLFGDLPKALSVVRAEFEKCARVDRQAEAELATQFFLTGLVTEEAAMSSAYCMLTESALEILMEGWRMCALLMDQSISNFSWRKNVLAFLQTDLTYRGWLDPHQVAEAESRRLQIVASHETESIRIEERTSLGAFVFRALQRSELAQRQAARVATMTENGLLTASPDKAQQGRSIQPKSRALLPATAARKKAKQKAADMCLQVSHAAFDSVKKTLEVYLKWMMHSEELRDLAAYRSVKAQIYGFQQAHGSHKAHLGMHHLRTLLILLLAHQFDVQFQQENPSPEHLDWELRCLLQVLRESWRHGAAASADPEFARQLAGQSA